MRILNVVIPIQIAIKRSPVKQSGCSVPKVRNSLGLVLWVCLVALPVLGGEVGRYRVTVRGISERRLGVALEHVLNTMALRDLPPPDLTMLERRAQADVPRLKRVLEARGYYAAEIEVKIDSAPRSPKVVFTVRRGERYRLGNVEVQIEDGESGAAPPDIPLYLRDGLASGIRADASEVLAAEQVVKDYFLENGYPFARWTARHYRLDHEHARLHGNLRLSVGPLTDFGLTVIEGNRAVRTSHISSLLPWRAGELFNAERLEAAQRNLSRGSLFASVVIVPADEPGADGRLPMKVTVRERAFRSVSVGVRYRTDEGVGGIFSWGHRNLAGAGEQLSFTIDASEDRTIANIEARKPAFRRHDQQLVGDLTLTDERPDQFDSRSIIAGARIERDPRRFWRVSAGGLLKTAQIRQAGVTERSTLIGSPLWVVYDTRTDLLDPVRGVWLGMDVTPMLGLPEADLFFVKTRQTVGTVWPVWDTGLRLAMRVRLSTVAGASHADVPADERLYGGGGGSVRGYAYQSLGPYREGHPEGGLSMIENALELRWRVTEKIGICVFFDSGQAFTDPVPETSGWARGAGLGARYYLPQIGPIRFDIAVPLDRRRDIDDSHQYYLSLGQAF